MIIKNAYVFDLEQGFVKKDTVKVQSSHKMRLEIRQG